MQKRQAICGRLAGSNEPPSRSNRSGLESLFFPSFPKTFILLFWFSLSIQFLRAVVQQVLLFVFSTAVISQSTVYPTTHGALQIYGWDLSTEAKRTSVKERKQPLACNSESLTLDREKVSTLFSSVSTSRFVKDYFHLPWETPYPCIKMIHSTWTPYTHPGTGVNFLLPSAPQLSSSCFPGEWCLGCGSRLKQDFLRQAVKTAISPLFSCETYLLEVPKFRKP